MKTSKTRFIVVEVEGNSKRFGVMDLTNAMDSVIQDRYGDIGWAISKFKVIHFDPFSSGAILHCTSSSCKDVVEACCALTHVGFESVTITLRKISGKLSVCEKHIKQMMRNKKSKLNLNNEVKDSECCKE